MMEIIYLIMLAINIILVLLKKQPKLILFANILFIIMLIFGVTATGDYQVYKLMYEKGINRSSIELFFNYMMDVSNKFGLSFDQFWKFWYIAFGAIYVWVFSRYSKNYPLLFSLYYIHLLFIDIDQIRSFYAGALLVLAIHNLFNKKKRRFILLTLIATLIHTEIIFFAPLILFNFDGRISNKIVKRMGITILIICIIMFIFGTRMEILSTIGTNILTNLGAESKTIYLTSATRFGFLLYFLLHLSTIWATYYLKKSHGYNKDNKNYPKIVNKVSMLQLYCIISFPLIMINMNFYRLYRITCVMNYIAWAAILDSMKLSRQYYKSLIAIYGATLLYRIPLVHGNSQIEMILNNNSHFGGSA